MRLLLVEVRRLFARRFFWIGALALVIGMGVVLVITGFQSHVPTEADWAQARATAASEVQNAESQRERCQDAQRAGSTEGEEFPPGFDCNSIQAPSAETFLYDNPFHFTEEMGSRTHVLSIVLALFAFLVGATAVGAEWNHGTLAALLLWEPRRLRVFLAKLGALVFGGTAVSVLAYAANVAGHLGVAELRGVVGTISPDFQRELALIAVRGLGVTLVGAAVGFAIAFTLRRTAAAMGVALAYFGVAEIGARSFFEAPERWLLTTYIQAWLDKVATVSKYSCTPGGSCDMTTFTITMWQGGAFLIALGLFALAVAAAVFRRREVA
jgi:ABC-type transport system involved in multi-copper enzyme maturation permease subunit